MSSDTQSCETGAPTSRSFTALTAGRIDLRAARSPKALECLVVKGSEGILPEPPRATAVRASAENLRGPGACRAVDPHEVVLGCDRFQLS
jgi:hypothetical protein